MSIIINPGAGPVKGGSRQQAIANVGALLVDLGELGVTATLKEGSVSKKADGGRYTCILLVNDQEREVEMPGLPLEQVRYMGEADQNIWNFPRLYVDGSSWLWEFALGILSAPGYEGED